MDVRNYKEGCMPKNWCFQTVVLEKTLESPLDCKEIKPVNPKGNQPWIFIGRTDAEAAAPILWPLDAKSQLIGKDPDVGKDWRQEEKENEMVGWHHWLNGHEFDQAPGDGEGQRGLACCSPCCKELDIIEWMNNNKSQPQRTCWSEPTNLPWFLPLTKVPIHLPEPLLRSMAFLWGWDPGEALGAQHHPSPTGQHTIYPGFVLLSPSLCQSNAFLLELTLC